jgi:hypothetical protein
MARDVASPSTDWAGGERTLAAAHRASKRLAEVRYCRRGNGAYVDRTYANGRVDSMILYVPSRSSWAPRSPRARHHCRPRGRMFRRARARSSRPRPDDSESALAPSFAASCRLRAAALACRVSDCSDSDHGRARRPSSVRRTGSMRDVWEQNYWAADHLPPQPGTARGNGMTVSGQAASTTSAQLSGRYARRHTCQRSAGHVRVSHRRVPVIR